MSRGLVHFFTLGLCRNIYLRLVVERGLIDNLCHNTLTAQKTNINCFTKFSPHNNLYLDFFRIFHTNIIDDFITNTIVFYTNKKIINKTNEQTKHQTLSRSFKITFSEMCCLCWTTLWSAPTAIHACTLVNLFVYLYTCLCTCKLVCVPVYMFV